jgi:tRNA threonylcarbamoyladenosine biosynthesis protein TsaB
MLLLITDTSGKHGFVGLVRADEDTHADQIKIIDEVPLAGGTFSAQLVPQIAALLANHGFSKRDMDAFVVVSGPGSFTGLRVGLAAIKALAEILGKPIVAVSLLEVIALASGAGGSVVATLDAGRSEVYLGHYEIADGNSKFRSERLLARSEFTSAAAGSLVATPDPDLATMARDAGLRVILIDSPNAEMIALLGCRKLHCGETVPPDQLDANYIRRSDAEIFSKPSSS